MLLDNSGDREVLSGHRSEFKIFTPVCSLFFSRKNSNRWYHLKFVKLIRGLHHFLYECIHSHTYRCTCIIVLLWPCLPFLLGVLVHPANLWTTIKVWFSAHIALISALHFVCFSLSHHKNLTTISLLTNEENELEECEMTFMVPGLRLEGWQ